jgi:hypothetical protein
MTFAPAAEAVAAGAALLERVGAFDLDDALLREPRRLSEGLQEGRGASSFMATLSLDLAEAEETLLFWEVFGGLKELAVFTFFGVSDSRGEDFLSILRGMHPPRPFESWALACDHFQFAAYCILHTEFGHALSDLEMIAVLLFMLASYSDAAGAARIGADGLATFGLEVGGGLSLTATLFGACAQARVLENAFDLESRTLWGTIRKIEDTETSWAGGSPAVVLAVLAKYSYMFRTPEVAKKWVWRKFTGMPEGTDREIAEIRRFELAADRDILFLPIFDEAVKIDKNMKSLLKNVQATYDFVMKV